MIMIREAFIGCFDKESANREVRIHPIELVAAIPEDIFPLRPQATCGVRTSRYSVSGISLNVPTNDAIKMAYPSVPPDSSPARQDTQSFLLQSPPNRTHASTRLHIARSCPPPAPSMPFLPLPCHRYQQLVLSPWPSITSCKS